MKHKSMSQMNQEKKRKPMTIEEEYRNADVPMPIPYNGGVAYTSFVKMFKGANGRKTKNKD
jgi:hypothetical protein